MTDTCAPAKRMIVPLLSISTTSSVPSTILSPATRPVFSVTCMVLMPLPPRFCTLYSSNGVRFPYPFSLMVNTYGFCAGCTSTTASSSARRIARTPCAVRPIGRISSSLKLTLIPFLVPTMMVSSPEVINTPANSSSSFNPMAINPFWRICWNS